MEGERKKDVVDEKKVNQRKAMGYLYTTYLLSTLKKKPYLLSSVYY
jgi:hypothetical protein